MRRPCLLGQKARPSKPKRAPSPAASELPGGTACMQHQGSAERSSTIMGMPRLLDQERQKFHKSHTPLSPNRIPMLHITSVNPPFASGARCSGFFLSGEICRRLAGKRSRPATAHARAEAERNHTMWCQDIRANKSRRPARNAALPTSPSKFVGCLGPRE